MIQEQIKHYLYDDEDFSVSCVLGCIAFVKTEEKPKYFRMLADEIDKRMENRETRLYS